jgi:hypothetical protein
VLPVAFAIPPEAAPCDPITAGDRTLWRLIVSASVPGVDYAATFEVPVFRTAASADVATEHDRQVASLSAVPADYRPPADSRIEVRTTRRGTEVYFPPARNPGAAAGLTIFLALWSAVLGALLHFHAPLILPIVFGAFELLLVWIALEQWLGATRVSAGDAMLTVANGWLRPSRARTLRAADVAEVTTRIGMQVGGRPYYDIVVTTTTGRTVAAGRGIRDKREAEWLAATLARAIAEGRAVGRSDGQVIA